jgi:hypothetical protein
LNSPPAFKFKAQGSKLKAKSKWRAEVTPVALKRTYYLLPWWEREKVREIEPLI